MTSLIGRSVSAYLSDQTEETRWIGKPWRRLESLATRTFHEGECIDVSRHWSAHLGIRRFGVAFTFSVTRQSVLDYSKEEHQ